MLLHNIKMSKPVEVLKICTYVICVIILVLRVFCFFIATAQVYREIQ